MLDRELDGDGDGVLVAVSDDRVIGALVADTAGARPGGTNGRGDDGDTTGGAAARNEDAADGDRSGAHVAAIAVRRRRRAQGIGTALIAAAAERWRPLSADFDADVRPFYEALGFEIAAIDEGRFRGRLR
nr:GNAT family N-acetyltransferase [Halarchaeum solikamskense]